MAKTEDKPQYHALYTKGDDQPVALIREDHMDHPEVQALRKSHTRETSAMVPVDISVKLDKATRQSIAALNVPEDDQDAANPLDDVRKGEIKTEAAQRQKEDQMRKDAEKELKDEKKESGKK